MDKTTFYNIPKEDKLAIYQNVGNRTGVPDFAVEKDWWVVHTLGIIFEMGPLTVVFLGIPGNYQKNSSRNSGKKQVPTFQGNSTLNCKDGSRRTDSMMSVSISFPPNQATKIHVS